jgi:Fe-S cluster assembly ATP-binding protein
MANILEIKDLNVAVGGKELLHGVNLSIPEGEVHALLGPNGSGKTSLIMTIMGYPEYRVAEGRILFYGEDITTLDISERSRRGIGIAHQRPPTVHGIKLQKMLEYINADYSLKDNGISSLVKDFNMEAFLDREINAGLSGGEIKRSELLQLMATRPGLVILDEPDSGVDIESLEAMGKMVNRLFSADDDHPVKRRAGIIITHNAYILKYVQADKAHVMLDGHLSCSGNPGLIFDTVSRYGYQECIRCVNDNETATGNIRKTDLFSLENITGENNSSRN